MSPATTKLSSLLPGLLLAISSLCLQNCQTTLVGTELEDPDLALFVAVEAGSRPSAAAALERGADINARLKAEYISETGDAVVGMTPLIIATMHADLAMLSYLLEKGAQVDVQDQEGGTALMEASGRGMPEKVRLLLKHQANPNLSLKNGLRALHAGVYSGKVEIVKMLLEAGANIHARSQAGDTALTMARKEKYPEIIKVLKQAGAR